MAPPLSAPDAEPLSPGRGQRPSRPSANSFGLLVTLGVELGPAICNSPQDELGLPCAYLNTYILTSLHSCICISFRPYTLHDEFQYSDASQAHRSFWCHSAKDDAQAAQLQRASFQLPAARAQGGPTVDLRVDGRALRGAGSVLMNTFKGLKSRSLHLSCNHEGNSMVNRRSRILQLEIVPDAVKSWPFFTPGCDTPVVLHGRVLRKLLPILRFLQKSESRE